MSYKVWERAVSKSRGNSSYHIQGTFDGSSVVPERIHSVRPSLGPEETDQPIAQHREGLCCIAHMHLPRIFSHGDIVHIMDPIFNRPVCATRLLGSSHLLDQVAGS